MARPLPPLNALRAFEAAARHMSLTRAAAELHVTQAAVSHQVKALERHIGVALFRRLPRSLLLTEAGQMLLPELREAFSRLARAVDRLAQAGRGGTLSISLLTTFALAWFVPRLPRFQALHPAIDVRISTSQKLTDFATEEVDAAVRYGQGPWPGLHHDKLFDDSLTPLCSPALARGLRRIEDLAGVPLLTTDYEREWPIWLKAAGLDPGQLRMGARFDSTRIAVQAAMASGGVAIGPRFLFAEEIAAGALVQPFPLEVRSGLGWWLVCPAESVERPRIQALRAWILDEAARSVEPAAASPSGPLRSAQAWVHAGAPVRPARAPRRTAPARSRRPA